MNSRHENLKFTFDFELNGSFSFLDVKITRGSKGFSSSVFRKSTLRGVFRNFGSFMLKSYKTGLVFALLLCCFTICSDMQSFHLEVKFWQHFKCNYYPLKFKEHCPFKGSAL